MKIAILSDIHGNYYALKEVLKELDKLNIKKIFLLGDYVGYYYSPEKVLKMLEKYDKTMIKGNHEIIMEESIQDNDKRIKTFEKYGNGINFAIENLNEKEKEFLINLPPNKKIKINEIKILLCHGSPWKIDYYIYPDTKDEIKNKCLNEFDFVFIGHSHYPFIYKKNEKNLVNVGSVGQNRKKGGIANWCILDIKEKNVTIKETKYNTKNLIEEVLKHDPKNEYLLKVLERK